MEDTPENDVTAEPPESPIHTVGTDHMTVIGGDAASTIAFYRDLLGMPLVLEQPNLDAPELTHLFFDTGDGRILTFLVGENRPTRPHRGPGNVHHLAFSIAPEEFEATCSPWPTKSASRPEPALSTTNTCRRPSRNSGSIPNRAFRDRHRPEEA